MTSQVLLFGGYCPRRIIALHVAELDAALFLDISDQCLYNAIVAFIPFCIERKSMNKKPTLKDVARHAGVSVATVSHVVNHTCNVSSATRELVLSSVEALNYRPDVMARSLKIGRCNLIAFVVPDIANAFFATLIEEVEQIVAEKGYRLLIMNTKETLERETGVLHALSRAIPYRKSKTQPNMI